MGLFGKSAPRKPSTYSERDFVEFPSTDMVISKHMCEILYDIREELKEINKKMKK